MKKGKSNFGFSYILNMANFEAFGWNISSSINSEIRRSRLYEVSNIYALWSTRHLTMRLVDIQSINTKL